MRTETLRVFCDLAETTSFSAAAHRNGITASAVSQMLTALEKQFNCPLLHRHCRDPQLTRAGQAFWDAARKILRLHDELERQLMLAKATIGGKIELGACHSIGLHPLPPVLDRFQRRFPAVRVNVRYDYIDRVHDAVRQNLIDLGLVCYPRHPHGLTVEVFRNSQLVLVCPPAHPLAARPSVVVPDLRGQTHVAWTEIEWSPFLKRIPNCQRHLLTATHKFNAVEPVKTLVAQGGGITVLPELLVRREVADGTLAAVPFADGDDTEPMAIIYRQRKRLTPAMLQLIAALKAPPEDG